MRVAQGVARGAVCAALLALLAACADDHGTAFGTIAGRLLAVGGPAPGKARPLPGTVKLQNTVTHVTSVIPVGADGRFAASVSIGTYLAEGRSPLYGNGEYACKADKTVTAATKATAVVDVYCQEA